MKVELPHHGRRPQVTVHGRGKLVSVDALPEIQDTTEDAVCAVSR